MTSQETGFIHDNFFRMFAFAIREAAGNDSERMLALCDSYNFVSTRTPVNRHFQSVSQFTQAFQGEYGLLAAQGMMVKAGRSFLRCVIREYPDDTGLYDPEFRMLPKPLRLFEGLHKLKRFFFEPQGISVSITDGDNAWQFVISVIKEFHQQDVDMMDYLAKFTNGMLQELMMWSTGGKYYPVYESDRKLFSDAPVLFVIDKKYIS